MNKPAAAKLITMPKNAKPMMIFMSQIMTAKFKPRVMG
jgi:hypothetical protein